MSTPRCGWAKAAASVGGSQSSEGVLGFRKSSSANAVAAGAVTSQFEKSDADAEIADSPTGIAGGQRRVSHWPSDAVKAIEEVRLTKRGGGTRKLTLREQLLLRSLMREPEDRSESDVQLLMRATAEVKFFQHVNEQQHADLCREMDYEIVPSGVTLFKQGQEGSTFYVVYRGSVKMYATDASQGWTNKCIATFEDGAPRSESAPCR